MLLDILLLFLTAAGITLVLWCTAGLFFCPVFDRNMMIMYYITNEANDLEARVRAYSWFRGSGLSGGRMVLVGQNLTPMAKERVARLCMRYEWLEYCEE